MKLICRLMMCAAVAALIGSTTLAQSNFPPEEFTAVAIVNNNLASGAGTVLMNVERWTSDAQRTMLAETLLQKKPSELLEKLRDAPVVGTIRTPDSLGYDLHYAHQTPLEDGGRRVVLATDRPIGFWEARNQPRTVDYPFTVIQMQFDKNGDGKGTLSYATKITVIGNTVELENFATSPVMLTQVKAKRHGD